MDIGLNQKNEAADLARNEVQWQTALSVMHEVQHRNLSHFV